MSEEKNKAPRDRSPSFPIISLKTAIDRLESFGATFGRHPAPYQKAGMAWGIKEGSSQANSILAALKAFGLLDYVGTGASRQVDISDTGRTYLRAQKDQIKEHIIHDAALKPKQFARFWPKWKNDRPIDAICLDELVLKHSFNDNAAPTFLRVYDETMAYAGLTDSDKVPDVEESEEAAPGAPQRAAHVVTLTPSVPPAPSPTPAPAPLPAGDSRKVALMENERVLTSGLLSKSASFRVLVEGPVSDKEIDRLIAKLELDKEILAEESSDKTEH